MTGFRVALVGRYPVPYPYSEHRGDHPTMAALAARSAALHLLVEAADGQAREWSDGRLHVHYAPARGHGAPRAARFLRWATRRLRSLHRDVGLDVINGSDPLGIAAGLLARRETGVPVAAQVQGQLLDAPPSIGPVRMVGTRSLMRALVRRADAVRCLYADAGRLALRAGVPPERLLVFPSRCDAARFDPAGHGPVEPGHLLFVGNLVEGKGVRDLLAALRIVCAARPEVRLTIAGSGPAESAWRALADRLAVAHAVRYVGRVPHDRLPGLLATAAALVLPSHHEATPRVIMEAMAMGRPVVATAVGGVPDLLDDRVHGRLVAAHAPAALADALLDVLGGPPWAAGLAERSRARAIASFSVPRHLDMLEALHARAVGRGADPSRPPPGDPR